MAEIKRRWHGQTVIAWQGYTGQWFARLHCPKGPNPHSEGWKGETSESVLSAAKAFLDKIASWKVPHPYMRH